MENAELARIASLLRQASGPEEVFGQLQGSRAEQLAEGRKTFLHLARAVHPDMYSGTSDGELAHEAFKRLWHLWEEARQCIEADTYGQTRANDFQPFVIQTGSRSYTLERVLTRGDLCTLYLGTSLNGGRKRRVLLKVPALPQDNDLAANEARILRHLQQAETYNVARPFVSHLVDSFLYEEDATGILRQVTVLDYVDGLFSLQEVRAAYPRGIDPKDMAWIWRRLLVALDLAHSQQVIHGCVLPPHILIHPAQHGVVLIDWSYAVLDPAGTHRWLGAIVSSYRSWYPAEVFAREEPGPGLDIYLAALTMIELLGGNPQERSLPASVPWQIQSYLKGCTLPRPEQRPQDAQLLLSTFDELLARLWGPRTYHPFHMPERQ